MAQLAGRYYQALSQGYLPLSPKQLSRHGLTTLFEYLPADQINEDDRETSKQLMYHGAIIRVWRHKLVVFSNRELTGGGVWY